MYRHILVATMLQLGIASTAAAENPSVSNFPVAPSNTEMCQGPYAANHRTLAELSRQRDAVHDSMWSRTKGLSEPALTNTINQWKSELQRLDDQRNRLRKWNFETHEHCVDMANRKAEGDRQERANFLDNQQRIQNSNQAPTPTPIGPQLETRDQRLYREHQERIKAQQEQQKLIEKSTKEDDDDDDTSSSLNSNNSMNESARKLGESIGNLINSGKKRR